MHHRADRLPLRQAVVAERREALSERGRRRRPGQPLALPPL